MCFYFIFLNKSNTQKLLFCKKTQILVFYSAHSLNARKFVLQRVLGIEKSSRHKCNADRHHSAINSAVTLVLDSSILCEHLSAALQAMHFGMHEFNRSCAS